jgi:hypothetical protein
VYVTTFKLKMQQYVGTVTALVMPEMMSMTDVILGDAWLHAPSEHASLCYTSGTCTLHKGGRKRTLALSAEDLPQPDDEVLHMLLASMIAALAPPPIISAKSAAKSIRKGAQYFTVLVRPKQDASLGASSIAASAQVGTAPANDKSDLQVLVDNYGDVFADLPPGLPPTRNVVHSIPLEPGSKPPAKRLYRLSPAELIEVKRQIKDLLMKGFIEPSTGPFGSPILFVAKKDGTLRMVIDYRAVNRITIRNRYPLPRIEDLFDSLQGATVFSSLDLQSGYHQLRIAPEDIPKTAFVTPVGTYQFKVLAQGLCNSPAVFSKAMADIFKDCIGKFVCVYLDDILIYSKTN